MFKLRSLDVIHSFFVPSFSEKLDAVPGITTTLRVTPNRLGTYPVECTELCGAGHSLMRTTVHVVSAGRLPDLAGRQPANGPPPIGTPPPNVANAVPGYGSSSGGRLVVVARARPTLELVVEHVRRVLGSTSAAAGKAVFTGSAGCSGCHTLAAAGATGTVGPNLDTRLQGRLRHARPPSRPAARRCSSASRPRSPSPYAYLPSRLQRRNHALDLRAASDLDQIQALVNFLAERGKVSSDVARRAGIVQTMDSGPRRGVRSGSLESPALGLA